MYGPSVCWKSSRILQINTLQFYCAIEKAYCIVARVPIEIFGECAAMGGGYREWR